MSVCVSIIYETDRVYLYLVVYTYKAFVFASTCSYMLLAGPQNVEAWQHCFCWAVGFSN